MKHSILELEGLGAEIRKGVDAQESLIIIVSGSDKEVAFLTQLLPYHIKEIS